MSPKNLKSASNLIKEGVGSEPIEVDRDEEEDDKWDPVEDGYKWGTNDDKEDDEPSGKF